MGLIKFLGKKALNDFKKSIEEIHDTLSKVDADDIENRLNSLREDLNKEFDKLKDQFKARMNKFVVKVPYDRDTQKMSFNIENGLITVVVETDEVTESGSFKSKSTTTRSIPESIDVNEFKHKYLEDEKKMLFIFKGKKTVEVTENQEVADDFEPIEEPSDAKEEIVKKMVHMHLNGCSYRKIAQECGVSDKTCKRWVSEWLTEHDAAGLS